MQPHSLSRRIVIIGAIVALTVATRDLLFNDEMLLGQDLSQVWTAGKLAISGHLSELLIAENFTTALHSMLPRSYPHAVWSYPPTALVIAVPLATLPYTAAVWTWTAVQAAMAWLATNIVTRSRLTARQILFVGLTSPGLILSCLFGHFAMPVACLMVIAIFILQSRPWLAGALIGLLAIKPQYGLLPGLALLITGERKAITSAAATVGALMTLVTLFWGAGAWADFLNFTLPQQTAIMGDLDGYRVVAHSVRDCLLLIGVTSPVAVAIQSLSSLIAVAATILVFRRDRDPHVRAFVVTVAAVVMLPYCNIYDQAIPAMGALALCSGRQRVPPLLLWGAYIIWLAPVLDICLGYFNILKIAPFVEIGMLASLLRGSPESIHIRRGVDTDSTAQTAEHSRLNCHPCADDAPPVQQLRALFLAATHHIEGQGAD